MRKIFSDEDIKFLRDNYDKMQYKDIAQILGKTERQVRGKINGMGLSKLREFDKSFFNCIDSPEKAYWLGLIFADGWVVFNETQRTYELGIELQEQDSYILYALVSALGGNHKVSHDCHHRVFNGYEYDTNTSRLRVYSKEIVCGLISNGVVANKTYSTEYPKLLAYKRDFVRGFLDGDGCITNSNRGNLIVTFTNANKGFLSYLRDMIFSECGVLGTIYTENDCKHTLRYFRVSDAKSFYHGFIMIKTCCFLKENMKDIKPYLASPHSNMRAISGQNR